jgi:hypothetical protein
MHASLHSKSYSVDLAQPTSVVSKYALYRKISFS